MQTTAKILLGISLIMVSLPVLATPPADAGVTRTQIEAWDNWGWQGGPESSARIICPGGELTDDPFPCYDSKTGRVYVRGGAGWSCITSDDPRMTGLGLWTTSINFDADATGPGWGEFRIVQMSGCNKDADYSNEYEDLAEHATIFWHGTWNGQRYFDSELNAWVLEVQMIGKGFGEGLDGLHFRGTERITMFTPFPMPYEYLFPYGSEEFDMPEAYLIGTIKD